MGRWSTRTSRSNDSRPVASSTSISSSRLLGVVGALAEVAAHELGEHLRDERRLARPRDAGDGRQDAERDVDGDVVEVVPADAAQVQPSLGFALRTWGSFGAAEEMVPGDRGLDVLEPVDRARVEHVAALLARARADVDDPVGSADDVEVVLDDEQRVARALERVEHLEQRRGVGRVQSRRRLVEDVDDAEETRPQLRRDAQALGLAG